MELESRELIRLLVPAAWVCLKLAAGSYISLCLHNMLHNISNQTVRVWVEDGIMCRTKKFNISGSWHKSVQCKVNLTNLYSIYLWGHLSVSCVGLLRLPLAPSQSKRKLRSKVVLFKYVKSNPEENISVVKSSPKLGEKDIMDCSSFVMWNLYSQ